MQELSISDDLNLSVSEQDGVTRKECLKSSDLHRELKGPISADNCHYYESLNFYWGTCSPIVRIGHQKHKHHKTACTPNLDVRSHIICPFCLLSVSASPLTLCDNCNFWVIMYELPWPMLIIFWIPFHSCSIGFVRLSDTDKPCDQTSL
jgi:hypothetical protein